MNSTHYNYYQINISFAVHFLSRNCPYRTNVAEHCTEVYSRCRSKQKTKSKHFSSAVCIYSTYYTKAGTTLRDSQLDILIMFLSRPLLCSNSFIFGVSKLAIRNVITRSNYLHSPVLLQRSHNRLDLCKSLSTTKMRNLSQNFYFSQVGYIVFHVVSLRNIKHQVRK